MSVEPTEELKEMLDSWKKPKKVKKRRLEGEEKRD
jgi:hypothetical protein